MKASISSLLFLLLAITCKAQQALQDIIDNVYLSAGYLAVYPSPQQDTLTPPPSGKKPFYISHYGRHGSRHLLEPANYTDPIDILAPAESAGVLTPFGKTILQRLRIIKENAENHYGELTTIGAEQCRGIAHRMARNFPEVFTDFATIDARSSIYIRCILSMESLLQELKAYNPKLTIFHDACENDMSFILPGYTKTSNAPVRQETGAAKAIAYPDVNGNRIATLLINDPQYIKSINTGVLMLRLYDIASQLQNTELRDSFSLYEIFNDDELFTCWSRKNIVSYNNYHKSNKCAILIGRIIDDAEKAIANNTPAAHMRFGHESVLMPLVCRMSVNNLDQDYSNANELYAAQWHNYRIYPMAGNLQIIFYRSDPNDADILVKVLLNETEATLPLPTDTPPYYHWSDVREYWEGKR